MSEVAMPISMPFTHLAAWRVIGSFGMLQETATITLASNESWSYVLTRDLDEPCAISDRGAALGNLTLQDMFALNLGGSFEQRLASEIEKIRQARRSKFGGANPILLFTGTGLTQVTVAEPSHQLPNYVIAFDAYNKTQIRQGYMHQHCVMQLSIGLESTTRICFEEAMTGTYCTASDGRTVYSLNFSGQGEGNASSPLPAGAAASIERRFALLSTRRDLSSSMRLFADMALYGREPFRVFISGWTALEILIKKAFKEYEVRFFSVLTIPHQTQMAEEFLGRVRSTMNGKHSLVDQFVLVSAVMLSTQSRDEAVIDLTKFKRIKKQRDEISHGEAFNEDLLPIVELSDLLMKYISAYAPIDVSSVVAGTAENQNKGTHVQP